MELARLGRRGQVSIPQQVLRKLGLDSDETVLLVEATADGAIVLRPAGVYPVEVYSDDRISEFLEQDRLEEDEARRLRARLGTAG